MKSPTFFLSSTIYDFRDLRSAIKYHLERQGCRVLASEFNDFTKPLNTHSYEACLQAIQEADWFILIIGTRVGGWYDEAAKVSITQREYREAYRLHQEGRLNLLTFVRSEVWQMRDERKQLAKFLSGLDISADHKATIASYPSKVADDAEFISTFITEVGRNKETREALSAGSSLPTGNWIHVFTNFQDIADAIQLQPFAGRPVEQTALRRLLQRELREILRQSLVKLSNGNAYSPRISVDLFHAEHTVNMPLKNDERALVNVALFDQLCSLSISILSVSHRPLILNKSLESSAFLQYDLATGTFTEEPVYTALLMLRDELQRFEMANKAETMKVFFENTPRIRPRLMQQIDVSEFQLVLFLHFMDRWCNIIELCKAVINHLDGATFRMPSLRPSSPVVKEDIQLKNEEATEHDVEGFLNR